MHEIHAYMEGMRAQKIEDLSEISIRGAMLAFFSCKESNMKKNSNTKRVPASRQVFGGKVGASAILVQFL